jgi:hypothetical protein
MALLFVAVAEQNGAETLCCLTGGMAVDFLDERTIRRCLSAPV